MNKLLSIGFLVFILSACETPPAHEFYAPINGEKWDVNQVVSTEFEIQDTLQAYNFFVNIRNNNNFEYSNLYVFIDTEFPNGKRAVDTVECKLAYPDGRWIGSGFGGVYDNRVMYKYKRRFPLEGKYKINLTQGMRDSVLDGVLDVGFRLEKFVR